jgi:hypothetical protein
MVAAGLSSFSEIAQQVERAAVNGEVPGSSPGLVADVDVNANDIMLICPTHGEGRFLLRGEKRGYRCRRCASEAVVRRRRRIRDELVAEAGGKCIRCGYSRCAAALEFHHLDPSQKDPDARAGSSISLARRRAEMLKCILVCANCHREIHSEAWK